MKRPKRTLSLVLSIVLIFGLLPVSAMAKEVNTLVLNAACLFSSTKGEATEFTFTTEKAGVYRFDLKDTNPKTHGGHLKLYSGSDELDPYSADYIYYGDMQPHISQSWNLNANTTYRLTHTPDEDVDPNTTHHYSLKPTYAGVPVNPVLSAGQSAQIKFLNVGGGCEDYYVAHFNVRVATSGFYRIDSTNRSYISTWGQLPQTVYFKNGKDYSFSANPASQSSAPANDTITLTAVQADCKTLTETSPVSLTEDGWISFTAPSAGTYCFKAQDSEGYLEFITVVNDEAFLLDYQREELIYELEHFSMQTGETVYFYVAHVTPSTGQMSVTKIGGSTEPDPTPETLTLVSSSPANGAVGFNKNDGLTLTFSQDISKNPDWTKGSIYIKNYSNDRTVLEIDSAKFYELGGIISGATMTIPGATQTLDGMKYYVVIDSNVISAKNAINGKIVTFGGISGKNALVFNAKLYGSNFTMGEDSFGFSQQYSGTFNNEYYISDEDLAILREKVGWLAYYWERYLNYGGGYNSDYSGGHYGACYGISSVMALMKIGQLSPAAFDEGAKDVFSMDLPKNNKTVASLIHYYNFLQFYKPFNEEDVGKTQNALGKELVDALRNGTQPVVLSYKFDNADGDKGEHAVLAYSINTDFDPDYYIVYVADPNWLVHGGESHGSPNEVSEPGTLYIDKSTLDATTLKCTVRKSVAADFSVARYQITKILSVISNLSIFEDFNLQKAHANPLNGITSGVGCSYSKLVTSAESFTISAGRQSSTVLNGSISGDLPVYGPYYPIGGDTETGYELQIYYVDSDSDFNISYPNSEKRLTVVEFREENGKALLTESDETTILFNASGNIELSEAQSKSMVTLTADSLSSLDYVSIYVTTSDLEVSQGEKGISLKTLNQFGNIKVEGNASQSNMVLSADVEDSLAYVSEKDLLGIPNIVLVRGDEQIDSTPITYSCIFMSNGGSFVDAVNNLEYNSFIPRPSTPTYSGYSFAGWYKDKALTDRWNFEKDQIKNNTILYAKWTEASGADHFNGSSSGSSSSTYAIAVENCKNGAVTADRKTASSGSTVTLTISPEQGWTLETLTVTNASGKEIDLNIVKVGEKYTFKMPSSNVTVAATFMEDNSILNSFVDVPSGSYYYGAVLWAVKNNITTGTDAIHFSPDGICTRAQAVTFLWRAAGSPAPKSSAMPFIDVPAGSYYYDAVLWAVENGIAKGTSDAAFSPDKTCTRAQIVTFLWRSQNTPAAGSNNSFTDVAADDYYADAVLWAVKENVTKGTGSTTFSPDDNCTRAQIVTFIWRTMT